MKRKAYIYPRTSRSKKITNNPYMNNFIQSIQDDYDIVNIDKPSDKGIFDLVKYVGKIEYLFLNWIEDLPDKKMGYSQAMFFLMILRIKSLLGIKVVWTIHNKISHFPENLYLKKILFRNLLKRSDLLITHAKEGIAFAESMLPGVSRRIFYFPHPIVPFPRPAKQQERKYDILIWGALSPYKGIHTFFEFLQSQQALSRYRIMVIGKASSEEFFNTLKLYQRENITLRNEFVDMDELSQLIQQSAVILFTYSGDSVLSSGALIDSIAHKTMVIGPDVGAFKEMGDLGIIRTYHQFDELHSIMESIKDGKYYIDTDRIASFISAHTWAEFGKQLKARLDTLNR